MFSFTRRSRFIAGIAATAAVALVPAAASSAAEAPSANALPPAVAKQLNAPAAKNDRNGKATAEQKRKANRQLNRIAKRAGLVPATEVGTRDYFMSNGNTCFYARAWNYTICFKYHWGAGQYAVFGWADSNGGRGYIHSVTLEVFLYGIGG